MLWAGWVVHLLIMLGSCVIMFPGWVFPELGSAGTLMTGSLSRGTEVLSFHMAPDYKGGYPGISTLLLGPTIACSREWMHIRFLLASCLLMAHSLKKKSCEPTRSVGVRGCDSLADIGVAVHLDCAGLYTIDLNTISWNHLPCMVPGKIWSKQEWCQIGRWKSTSHQYL